jgi:hypothetical protein
MKFSVGDKILMKRTGEEGTVTDFIGKDMLEVEVNGISFPVYLDEVEHPYLKWFTDKNYQQQTKKSQPEQLPVESIKQRAQKLPQGVHLSFIPVFKSDEFEDIVQQVKIYLVNEMPVPVLFRYDVRIPHESHFRHEGNLHAFGNLFLHSLEYELMSAQPRFHWELSDASHPEFKTEADILKIKPSKLFEHINELLLKNEPSFNYKLVDDFVEKPKQKKKETFTPTLQPQVIALGTKKISLQDLPKYELDLHIEQLTDKHSTMSNSEMLTLQIRTLEKYLHLAIVHRIERMIVIHGLGKGALKDAVHQTLQEMPEVKHFRNEWMGKYGYGATEIIFKR